LRIAILLLVLSSVAVVSLPAGTISLTGTGDLVAFDGKLDTVTLGWVSCTTAGSGTCTYGGSQSLGAGTLTWQFQTPNVAANITYDPSGDDLSGPAPGPTTGGTFSAGDGVDSVGGTYAFSSWNFDSSPYGSDSQFYGIDLNGVITVTSLTLEGGGDPNGGAFTSFLMLPETTSYSFTLDVGDCTAGGNKTVACIITPDPTAYFNALTLTQATTQSTPEPGTVGLLAAGLLAAIGWRHRTRIKVR
jgi:hypothetical protein